MKEYYHYFKHGKDSIKFYNKETSRKRTTRLRWSSVYVSNRNYLRPFKVYNYFLPAFFYNGIMNHRKNTDCGYLVVQRGIHRNLQAKGVY